MTKYRVFLTTSEYQRGILHDVISEEALFSKVASGEIPREAVVVEDQLFTGRICKASELTGCPLSPPKQASADPTAVFLNPESLTKSIKDSREPIATNHTPMKQRNPIAVLFLPFFTFGIYGLVWTVKTKNEMNQRGAKIPTAWLLIIPLANIYWMWVYGTGVALVTKGAHSALGSFCLRIFLGPIGSAITQNEFNKVGAG